MTESGAQPESGLYPDVLTALRAMRHDLAGRAQAIMSILELTEYDSKDVSEAWREATEMLRSVLDAWREELRRFDLQIQGPGLQTSIDSETLAVLLERKLPSGMWVCDPVALNEALRHAYKTLGRLGLRTYTVKIDAGGDHFRMTVAVGEPDGGVVNRPYLSFPGDFDAAIVEAESRLAGVLVSTTRSVNGAAFVFTVSAD